MQIVISHRHWKCLKSGDELQDLSIKSFKPASDLTVVKASPLCFLKMHYHASPLHFPSNIIAALLQINLCISWSMSCTDPVLSPFTLTTQKLCTEILFSYIVFRHSFGIRLTSRGGGRSPKNSFVKGIKTEMGNYVLKTLIYLKRKWRQKHVLTKQEVWGRVLLTTKTLTCTWKALEKHDFNLLQLHILKKRK